LFPWLSSVCVCVCAIPSTDNVRLFRLPSAAVASGNVARRRGGDEHRRLAIGLAMLGGPGFAALESRQARKRLMR
jgi:hypothetical protein